MFQCFNVFIITYFCADLYSQVDDCRRHHNYDPFILTFLTMLAERGLLSKLLEQENSLLKRMSISSAHSANKSLEKKNAKRKRKR